MPRHQSICYTHSIDELFAFFFATQPNTHAQTHAAQTLLIFIETHTQKPDRHLIEDK